MDDDRILSEFSKAYPFFNARSIEQLAEHGSVIEIAKKEVFLSPGKIDQRIGFVGGCYGEKQDLVFCSRNPVIAPAAMATGARLDRDQRIAGNTDIGGGLDRDLREGLVHQDLNAFAGYGLYHAYPIACARAANSGMPKMMLNVKEFLTCC